MPCLILTPRFERSFQRLVKKNPSLQGRIEDTLRRMEENLDDSKLKTHHLSGTLAGLYACTVAYDCRIVFAKEKNAQRKDIDLILIDIGSHDEVY